MIFIIAGYGARLAEYRKVRLFFGVEKVRSYGFALCIPSDISPGLEHFSKVSTSGKTNSLANLQQTELSRNAEERDKFYVRFNVPIRVGHFEIDSHTGANDLFRLSCAGIAFRATAKKKRTNEVQLNDYDGKARFD